MNMKEKLKSCLNQIQNMTQKEFDSIISAKKIDQIDYDITMYEDSSFHIIFDDTTKEKNYINKITNCKINKSIFDVKGLFSKNEVAFNVNYESTKEVINYSYKSKSLAIDKHMEKDLEIAIVFDENSKKTNREAA